MPEKFEIRFKKSAKKDLLGLAEPNLSRLVKKISGLGIDPHPPDSIKLTGVDGYRVRQGDWRIVYEVDEAAHVVVIRKVGHRREVYRG